MKRIFFMAIILVASLLLLVTCNRQTNRRVFPVQRTMDTTFVTQEECRIERFRIHSACMEREIKAVVVLPPAYATEPNQEFPVLYTLHGYGAPYDTWANMLLLRKELKTKPFIYTCFDGDVGSAYIDSYYPIATAWHRKAADPDTTKRKSLFLTFFFKEFVPAIDAWYRVDTDKRGVTGFSMGAGGAFTYMLENPGMFSSVSGLSAAFFDFSDTNSRSHRRIARMLGPRDEYPERYTARDHYEQLKKSKAQGVAVPPVYLHCGTEDRLLDQNRKMHQFLQQLGIRVKYVESHGEHNWKFWHPASVGVAQFHWAFFKGETR